MIITRDIINKNIKFHDPCSLKPPYDLGLITYDFNEISVHVDGFKNLLVEKGCVPGDKVIIGENSSLMHTASIIACAELGLNICIINDVGETLPVNTSTLDSPYSSEIETLRPFKFLIINYDEQDTFKIKRLKAVCEHTLCPVEFNLTSNKEIYTKPDTVFLSCVVNGKVITHSHEFIVNLIKRNSRMFYGKAAITANLNHGSSPAAYFLPIIVSENVTDIFMLLSAQWKFKKNYPKLDEMLSYLTHKNIKLDHILFSYPKLIFDFLNSNPKEEQCIIYTLAAINEEWVEFVYNKNIKDIVSLYGTSECSGPVLINQVTDLNFSANIYKKVDDFYDISLTDKNKLRVGMPIYNRTIEVGDTFEFTNDGRYTFKVMKYIPRINDLLINITYYKELFRKEYDIDTEIILDSFQNNIYLAIWNKNIDQTIIEQINNIMRKHSDGLHFISKYDYLNKENFIDQLSLLKYFKNKST